MTTDELTKQALALPLADRLDLAQALWQSIHDAEAIKFDAATYREARSRADELQSGAVQGLTREEVMRDARRVLGCD